MMADREKTHHLFKNTKTTVLAMFKSMQAPSTILDRSPFPAGGPLLLVQFLGFVLQESPLAQLDILLGFIEGRHNQQRLEAQVVVPK
jgi:hypothetical protein